MLAGAFALFRAGRDAEGSLLVDQPAAQGDAEGLFTLSDVTWRGGAEKARAGAGAFPAGGGWRSCNIGADRRAGAAAIKRG